MNFPSSVLSLVEKAVAKYPNDQPKAIATALASIKGLKEYPRLVEDLLMEAVQSLVSQRRQSINRVIRNNAKYYGGPAKVVIGKSVTIARVTTSVFLYNIGGRTLGDIFGSELQAIADSERKAGDGHYFNAKLADALLPLVPEDKKVGQSVSEKKMKSLFKKLRAEPLAMVG